MKIVFVLPFSGKNPGGGIKVVYSYANHLVACGHQVTVVHPAGLYLGIDPKDRWYKNFLKYALLGLTKKYRPKDWFRLDTRVEVRWVPSLAKKFIPNADIVVATAWGTAEWVVNYPASKGQKYYLIQGFEDWSGTRDRVLATWKMPFKKIVISHWLQAIATSLNERSRYIPNGLDFMAFGVDIPPEARDPSQILMLYHHLEIKGSADGLKVLSTLKGRFPSLKATLFGVVTPAEGEIPDWIVFEHKPTQKRLRALYNQSSIFISPSLTEGWALPPAEAMQCGCATVLTDIGGHEYAVDGKTSLLSAPKDVDLMTKNVLRLLQDDSYRVALAYSAISEISQFSWSRACDSLEGYFRESIQ